jgi:hypothetical protein
VGSASTPRATRRRRLRRQGRQGVRDHLRVPLPGPRDHGADELRRGGRRQQGQADPSARRARPWTSWPRPRSSDPAGLGRDRDPVRRRLVRPARQLPVRLCRRVRPHRQEGRQGPAGEAGLDARGRHAGRLFPAAGPPRREGPAGQGRLSGRLASPHRQPVDHEGLADGRQGARPDGDRGHGRLALSEGHADRRRPTGFARRRRAGAVVALGGRDPHRLRHGAHHRPAGRQGRQGSRRVSPRAVYQGRGRRGIWRP